jgi:hypothetical protein
VTLPNRVAASAGHGVDETVECFGLQIVVTDDGPAVRAGNVCDRRQLPQQVFELRLTLGAGTAQVCEDAGPGGLPEVGGVEQFDDEEVAAGRLDAFADLPKQVCLARTRLSAHDDAQRRRDRVTDGITECVHDVVGGMFVQPSDVRRGLRSPQVVRCRGPRQSKGREHVPLRFVHHGSIAIRCLF